MQRSLYALAHALLLLSTELKLVEREGLGPSLVRLKGGCATLTLALHKIGGLGGIRTHTKSVKSRVCNHNTSGPL
jgi:hypothetical protein